MHNLQVASSLKDNCTGIGKEHVMKTLIVAIAVVALASVVMVRTSTYAGTAKQQCDVDFICHQWQYYCDTPIVIVPCPPGHAKCPITSNTVAGPNPCPSTGGCTLIETFTCT